jgi:Pectate lyase superfamily protein
MNNLQNIRRLMVALVFFTVTVFLGSFSVVAAVYDGAAVKLNAPAAGGANALTYASDPNIFVYAASGAGITACPSGSVPTFDAAKTRWNIPRNTTTGYWCFQSNATSHDVVWTGTPGTVTVGDPGGRTLWFPNSNGTGFNNVKDFGAVGNGTTDDTDAIRKALLYLAAKGGGTMYFPKGKFKVTSTISLPGGILIQGSMGKIQSAYLAGADSESSSQILFSGSGAVFRIGQLIDNVRIKNIELKATSNTGTYGVEAVGKNYCIDTTTNLPVTCPTTPFPPNIVQAGTSSQVFSFDNMVFTNFERGIYAHDATSNTWQFDYIRVDNCVFNNNRTAGIHLATYNSDWNIRSSFFNLPAKTGANAADGIYISQGGAVLVENTFGGGIDYANAGGDFIEILSISSLSVLNSSSERSTNSIHYGDLAGTGDLSTIIYVKASIFGDPILLKQRVNYVSSGNLYIGSTVNASNSGVKIYSNGDRFCYDSVTSAGFTTQPCGPSGTTNVGFQGIGRVMFQTGQTQDGVIPALPAKIGSDTEIKSDSDSTETKPILKITATNVPGQGKTFLEMGQDPFFYRLSRDKNTGFLSFEGTQATPFKGYIFDSPVKLPAKLLADILLEGIAGANAGSMIYCINCIPNTSPCQSGGSGALAITNGSQWSCK